HDRCWSEEAPGKTARRNLMNKQRLRRLLHHVVLGSIPWSVAAGTTACGDSGSGSAAPGPDASEADVGPAAEAAGNEDATKDAAGDQDAHVAEDASNEDASNEDASNGDASNPDASEDPCAPFSGFPGCGGGQNFCVVPDAGTGALADAGAFGSD